MRYPKVLGKLRKEVDSVAGDRPDLQREDLKEMPYLANVLKESKLRSIPLVYIMMGSG